MDKMNANILKLIGYPDKIFFAVAPGNTSGVGAALITPIWNNKIKEWWIAVSSVSTDNLFVVEGIWFEEYPSNLVDFEITELMHFFRLYDYILEQNRYELTGKNLKQYEAYIKMKRYCRQKLGRKYFW